MKTTGCQVFLIGLVGIRVRWLLPQADQTGKGHRRTRSDEGRRRDAIRDILLMDVKPTITAPHDGDGIRVPLRCYRAGTRQRPAGTTPGISASIRCLRQTLPTLDPSALPPPPWRLAPGLAGPPCKRGREPPRGLRLRTLRSPCAPVRLPDRTTTANRACRPRHFHLPEQHLISRHHPSRPIHRPRHRLSSPILNGYARSSRSSSFGANARPSFVDFSHRTLVQ